MANQHSPEQRKPPAEFDVQPVDPADVSGMIAQLAERDRLARLGRRYRTQAEIRIIAREADQRAEQAYAEAGTSLAAVEAAHSDLSEEGKFFYLRALPAITGQPVLVEQGPTL